MLNHSVLSDSLRPHSPPGSSVPGILQARILEWVAIFFSRGSPGPRIEPALLHWQAGSFFFNWRLMTLQYYIGFAIH